MLTLVMGAGLMTASAQSLRVKGTVTYEEDGTPVIGATILVEGTDVVAVSDVYGNYQITVPSSAASKVLVASYAGLAPQSQAVTTNNQTINFVMATDLQAIESVVVTGYGAARKVGTIVGSVEQISSKELENRPSASVVDALQGKVAGLQIYTSSGEPSETQSVRLHGVGSLYAGSTPLYVLDGIQVSSTTIQAMNPNDFESITVLKDASATSIYGSRAANGVIVYTTKRGKTGDAQINVRAQYGVSTQATTTAADNMMSRSELWEFGSNIGIYTQEQIEYYTSLGYNTVDTDWFRYYQQEWAPTFQGDISIAGGNERTNYYVSAGIFEQEGLVVGSYYNKMNFRANLETKVKDWMKFGTNIQLYYDEQNSNANYSYSNNINGGLSYVLNPMYPTYELYQDDSGVWQRGDDYWDEPLPGYGTYNPRYNSELMPYIYQRTGTSSSAYIQLEPLENLIIKSLGGVEYMYAYSDYKRLASYAGNEGNGYMYMADLVNLTATITNTIQYSFDINKKHEFSVLLGQEGILNNYRYNTSSTEGLTDDDLMQLGFGDQETYDVASYDSAYSYLSYFGNLTYAWDNKLYVDATVRNDQSSRFGPDNRAATFWALGAMFNFKNQFLQSNTTITNLTGKVSYGTQGNSSIGNYEWQGLVGVYSAYNGVYGYGPTTAANPDLQWETQTKLTVAASISLWNKLNIDIEYYLRNTNDMLMEIPLPSTSGFDAVLSNVGGLRNEGIDFTIDYDILRSSDYYLNAAFNINYNKETITELFDGRDTWTISGTGITYVVGQGVMYYMPIYAGVNSETGEQEWYLPGDDITETTMNETTTEYNVDDLSQNTGYRRNAPIAGGFSLSGGWKGISLSADFSYVIGKYMINNDKYFYSNPNVFGQQLNYSKDVLNYWQEAGDVTIYPDWSTGATMNVDDTFCLENASFLRLKNLTIGYNLPSKWFQNQNVLSGVKVYATGRNLLTVTEYTGTDPETDSNLSLGENVNTKQFVFGIELVF